MSTDIITYLSPLFIAIFILLCMCRFVLYGCCCRRRNRLDSTSEIIGDEACLHQQQQRYMATSAYRDRSDMTDPSRNNTSSTIRIHPSIGDTPQPASVWSSSSLPQYASPYSIFSYFGGTNSSDTIPSPSRPIPPPKYEDALRQCVGDRRRPPPPPYSDEEMGTNTNRRRSLIDRILDRRRSTRTDSNNHVCELPPAYTPALVPDDVTANQLTITPTTTPTDTSSVVVAIATIEVPSSQHSS